MSSHPMLQKPCLYLPNAPPRVKWRQLVVALASCGPISDGGSFKTQGSHKTWVINFEDMDKAEMALAIRKEIQVGPPHSPYRAQLLPDLTGTKERLPDVHPIMVPCITDVSSTPQGGSRRFAEFRPFGPLYQIRTDVDLGFPERGDLLYFWDSGGAQAALKHLNTVVKGPWVRIVNRVRVKCTGFGPDSDISHFIQLAISFKSSGSQIMEPSKGKRYGILNFMSEQDADTARLNLHGLSLPSGQTLVARYLQPTAVKRIPNNAGHWVAPQNVGDREGEKTPNHPTPKHGKLHQGARQSREDRREEYIRARQTRRRQTWEALQAARADSAIAVKTMHDARSAEVDAATKLLESDGVRQKLVAAADHARLLREEAQRKEENAFRAVADAERQFEAVGTEARRLAEEASLAQQAVDAAQAAERQCEVDWHEAGGVDPSSQTAAATAPPEPHIKASSEPETSTSTAESFDEEQAARDREAELAESVRRMQEIAREERLRESVRRMAAFAAEEKRRTEEAAAQKRQAAQEAKERVVREEQEQRLREEQEREERLARERWERQVQERKEREVREARKREEQERLERKKLDEARLRALVDATKKERARCLLRDSQLIGFAFLWSPPVAINRFKVINQEFDNIIFSDDHPFTFESAPWPHLGWPRSLKIEDIEWSSVEEFFTAVESSMPLPDYKDLVEKSHRRFHPDKWRARRLLQTVHDESLRDQLEKAGIAVSQALTPIWLESRKLR